MSNVGAREGVCARRWVVEEKKEKGGGEGGGGGGRCVVQQYERNNDSCWCVAVLFLFVCVAVWGCISIESSGGVYVWVCGCGYVWMKGFWESGGFKWVGSWVEKGNFVS